MSRSGNDPHSVAKRQAMRWAETGASPPQAAPATSDRDAGGAMPAQHDDIWTEDASLPDGSNGRGLSPSEPAPALAPGSSIGQYEIIRLLGRGGMGEVHLARDLRLGRLVAVKLLTMQRPDLGERFLAEARATARCHHENIVVIHEVGDDGEHGRYPYMVLEYLEGQTLRQWLREHTAAAAAAGQRAVVPPGRAVELMLPVVRALAYAHEQGIVHRDLKPENVMLTRSGIVKVLDFGIAKLLAAPAPDEESAGAAHRQGSTVLGTLPYMSPEQMNAGAIDHRTDVWTAGIMLFELVAGAHPVLDGSPSPAALMDLADEDTRMPLVRERVPDLGPLAAVIDRCLIKDPAHRTPSARVLLAELEALAPARRPLLVGEDGSPFAGLAAFQEADANRFFGRDRDIEQVVTELRSRPFVAVVGPSGAGKSSLVRAGVIPALKHSGEGWDAQIARPGREPLAALAAIAHSHGSSSGVGQSDDKASGTAPGDGAASAVLGPIIDPLIERLRAEPGYLGALLRARATSKLRRVLVFVDQLEELYTLGAPADERAAFLACLAAVADDAASPLRVIVSMRSDFLDRLTEDRRVGAEVTRGLVLLPPMDRDGMREALLRPVEASEHHFEQPELVDRMVDALAATPGALPLLQFAAARLWELRDRERRLLTEASYERLGGVAGALAMHADTVLGGMSSARQALARAVFERLVTPERTRALVSVGELRALHRDPDTVDNIVQYLAAMRLLVIERGAEGEGHSVELVHESLIDRWPTLARWLSENQDDAAMLARLRSAARDWERGGHAAGLLWTGEAVRETRVWHQRYQGRLTVNEEQYLAAVFTAAERQRRLRRRLLGGALLTSAVVAMVMAYLAWQESKASHAATRAASQAEQAAASAEQESVRAEQEAIRARDATRMAVARGLPDDPTIQLALLREIEDTNAPPRGATHELRRLLHADVAHAILTGFDNPISALAVSPDGSRIAAGTDTSRVLIWNANGAGNPHVIRVGMNGPWGSLRSIVFSPDSARFAMGSADGTVSIWNADGSGTPLIFRGDSIVSSVEFCSDGSRVAAVSMDGMIRIWNIESFGTPTVLRGQHGIPGAVAFSPDCSRIAFTAQSDTGTVQIRNTDGSGAPIVLRGQAAFVALVAFSPDGSRVATTSPDETIRIWNADGTGTPVVLRGHEAPVLSVAFSYDGSRLASGSWDGTVRIWNTDGSGSPRILRGHKKAVAAVGFDASGARVASASHDKTVRVWNTKPSHDSWVLNAPAPDARAIDLSPDGSRIVSAHGDGTVRIWNIDGSGASILLHGHDEAVRYVAFSRDGVRVAAPSRDGSVYVWDNDGPHAPIVLRGHHDWVSSVDFSPDGSRIVTASSIKDSAVRIWNSDGVGSPVVLRGYYAAVFNPDSPLILSISAENSIRAWSADGPGTLIVSDGRIFPGLIASLFFVPDDFRRGLTPAEGVVPVWIIDHPDNPFVVHADENGMGAAVFSPDGSRIAFASGGSVLVWNADGSGVPVIRPARAGLVEPLAFSADGFRIASASSKDKSIRIWDIYGSGVPLVLRGHDERVSSIAFSPDDTRIVSTSYDKTMRVWRVDGTGEPLVMPVQVHDPQFTPDGQRIVGISDGEVRVWEDIALPGLSDQRLWTATNYCMSINARQDLLGLSEELAQRDFKRCLQRVEQARYLDAPRPQP